MKKIAYDVIDNDKIIVQAVHYAKKEGESISNEELRQMADEGYSIVQAWVLGPYSAYGPRGYNIVFAKEVNEDA